METGKSLKINFFVKFIPIIIYVVLWTIDVWKDDPIILNIISGLFAAGFSLFIEQWGLVIFEVYIFLKLRGKARTVMGIIVIVVCAISALWMYLFNEFIFAFAGYWRPTLVIMLCMNLVYILVTALIMGGKLRT